jgi:MoaA/NifB/PqqE/SkfB family radical SAM enzyme
MSKQENKYLDRYAENKKTIFFALTKKCNLSCKYCYVEKSDIQDKELTTQEIFDYLRKIKDYSSADSLVLLGGEPTLRPDLFQIIEYSQNSLKFKNISLDTNGCFSSRILEELDPKVISYIGFSLDGENEDTNIKLRSYSKWNLITSNIKLAIASGFNIGVGFTLGRLNMLSATKMPALMSELGVKKLSIHYIGVLGNAKNLLDIQLTKEEWVQCIAEVQKEVKRYNLILSYPKMFLEKGKTNDCYLTSDKYYFCYPDGKIYNCPLIQDTELNVLEYKNEDIYKNLENINTLNELKNDNSKGCVINIRMNPKGSLYNNNSTRLNCCLVKE